jgi:hypothetical protein
MRLSQVRVFWMAQPATGRSETLLWWDVQVYYWVLRWGKATSVHVFWMVQPASSRQREPRVCAKKSPETHLHYNRLYSLILVSVYGRKPHCTLIWIKKKSLTYIIFIVYFFVHLFYRDFFLKKGCPPENSYLSCQAKLWQLIIFTRVRPCVRRACGRASRTCFSETAEDIWMKLGRWVEGNICQTGFLIFVISWRSRSQWPYLFRNFKNSYKKNGSIPVDDI